MTSEFEQDLARCRDELDAARRELLAVVTARSDADLERVRRGEWPVRRILEHVIASEWIYSRLVSHLRGQPVPGDAIDAMPKSVSDAADRLSASRAALLKAVDGVDEDSFYTIGKIGHEEYSILSVLENEINHEREHATQIARTVSG